MVLWLVQTISDVAVVTMGTTNFKFNYRTMWYSKTIITSGPNVLIVLNPMIVDLREQVSAGGDNLLLNHYEIIILIIIIIMKPAGVL